MKINPTSFSANGWVGWTNKKSPLELTFVFESFQSIQEVNIVAYNKPDMGIEVSCHYIALSASET